MRNVKAPESVGLICTLTSSQDLLYFQDLAISVKMETLPTKQTAVVALQDGTLAITHDAPVPILEDNMILVQNMAAALNPVDSKLIGDMATPGALAGMDFAGRVVSIGKSASTPTPLRVGDRVCGSVQGMHTLTPTIGAFSQYVGACDMITLKLPDSMSYEEGASLGVGLGTAILALFRSLELPGDPMAPTEQAKTVLVYGGSTATGTLAIQLLKLYDLFRSTQVLSSVLTCLALDTFLLQPARPTTSIL